MKDAKNSTAAARKAAATREIKQLTLELTHVKARAAQGWKTYLGDPIHRVISNLAAELETMKRHRVKLNQFSI